MEHHNEPLGGEAPIGSERERPLAGEPVGEARALFAQVREEMERDPEPGSRDLESVIAWSDAVHRGFTELAGDPEFEAWLNDYFAAMESRPEYQERVAHDRAQFLAMVRELYGRREIHAPDTHS